MEDTHLALLCYSAIHRALSMDNQQWLATRKLWFKANPPRGGGYVCVVCLFRVIRRFVSLDHIVRQTDCPELRFVLSNLQPTHMRCNSLRDQIMTYPLKLAEMRSQPLYSFEREVADRVIEQGLRAYREAREAGYVLRTVAAPPATMSTKNP